MTSPAVQLRVKVEEVLTPLLGQYTLPSGAVVPAISLGEPPEGTTARGLECLIANNPRRDEQATFAYVGAATAYAVRLINWGEPAAPETAQADILQDACNLLAPVFWPFWDDPRVTEATADNPEQVTLSLLYDPTQYPQEG